MNERFRRLLARREPDITPNVPDADTILRLIDTLIFFARTLDVHVSVLPPLSDVAWSHVDYDVAEPNTRTMYYLLRVIFLTFDFDEPTFLDFLAILKDKIES